MSTTATEILSKTAYLLGVDMTLFTCRKTALAPAVYKEMAQDDDARILNLLCALRTIIARDFGKVVDEMVGGHKSLDDVSRTSGYVRALQKRGVNVNSADTDLNRYLCSLNDRIAGCIDRCRRLYPASVQWDSVRALILIPNGQTVGGMIATRKAFAAHRSAYPYSSFLNWTPRDGEDAAKAEARLLALFGGAAPARPAATARPKPAPAPVRRPAPAPARPAMPPHGDVLMDNCRRQLGFILSQLSLPELLRNAMDETGFTLTDAEQAAFLRRCSSDLRIAVKDGCLVVEP